MRLPTSKRFLDRMRDEDHGEADVFPQPDQFFLHLAAGERIERGERLVHQQHGRLHRERARDGDALLHAAGQHVRIDVREFREIHLGDQRARMIFRLLARHAAIDQEREHHVAEHRLPRQQLVEFLEHHHAVGTGPVDHLTVEPDGSLDRLHESADGLQQRRLAATGRAEQHKALAGKDLEIHPVGRGDQMLGGLVLQRNAVHAQHRSGIGGCSRRGRRPVGRHKYPPRRPGWAAFLLYPPVSSGVAFRRALSCIVHAKVRRRQA